MFGEIYNMTMCLITSVVLNAIVTAIVLVLPLYYFVFPIVWGE